MARSVRQHAAPPTCLGSRGSRAPASNVDGAAYHRAVNIPYATIFTGIAALASAVAAIITAVIAAKTKTATVHAAHAADGATNTAAAMVEIERQRRHDETAPDIAVGYEWQWNKLLSQWRLYAVVLNQGRHEYVVDASLMHSNETCLLNKDLRLAAGDQTQVAVGSYGDPFTGRLQLDFDPRSACPCELPSQCRPVLRSPSRSAYRFASA